MQPSELVAVGFAGHARSGKTTLARAVAAELNDVTTVGFGRAVNERVQALGGDGADRHVLVEAGARWVAEDPSGLCAAVLAQGDRAARWWLIDGIRHGHVWLELACQLAPAPLCLVYVDVPNSLAVQPGFRS